MDTPRAYGQLTADLLVTLATEDLAWWGTLVGLDAGELAAVELPAERFTLRRAGWPGDWT